MKKIIVAGLIAGLLLELTCNAREIAGVVVKESIVKDTLTFHLQGAGVRDKFFMDLYVASFYLSASPNKTLAVFTDNLPMVLELQILSSLITSEKMKEATNEGFINATKGNTAPIQKEIDAFIDTFKETIAINDRYEFFYLPSIGTRISKNGVLQKNIEGVAFKEALFGIWLGEKPAQESLKKDLLGK